MFESQKLLPTFGVHLCRCAQVWHGLTVERFYRPLRACQVAHEMEQEAIRKAAKADQLLNVAEANSTWTCHVTSAVEHHVGPHFNHVVQNPHASGQRRTRGSSGRAWTPFLRCFWKLFGFVIFCWGNYRDVNLTEIVCVTLWHVLVLECYSNWRCLARRTSTKMHKIDWGWGVAA